MRPLSFVRKKIFCFESLLKVFCWQEKRRRSRRRRLSAGKRASSLSRSSNPPLCNVPTHFLQQPTTAALTILSCSLLPSFVKWGCNCVFVYLGVFCHCVFLFLYLCIVEFKLCSVERSCELDWLDFRGTFSRAQP